MALLSIRLSAIKSKNLNKKKCTQFDSILLEAKLFELWAKDHCFCYSRPLILWRMWTDHQGHSKISTSKTWVPLFNHIISCNRQKQIDLVTPKLSIKVFTQNLYQVMFSNEITLLQNVWAQHMNCLSTVRKSIDTNPSVQINKSSLFNLTATVTIVDK